MEGKGGMMMDKREEVRVLRGRERKGGGSVLCECVCVREEREDMTHTVDSSVFVLGTEKEKGKRREGKRRGDR